MGVHYDLPMAVLLYTAHPLATEAPDRMPDGVDFFVFSSMSGYAFACHTALLCV